VVDKFRPSRYLSVLMATKRFGTGDELQFVLQLIKGDEEASRELDAFRSDLERVLVSKGASATDASEIVGNVIGECCGPESKLKKFQGDGSLASYLMTMVRFAWIDWVRRDGKSSALPEDPDQRDFLIAANDPNGSVDSEQEVIAILKEALLEAFAETESEKLLILRLVFEQKLSQSALAVPWACSQATLSRRTSDTLADLRERILAKVHRLEPNFQIRWDDLLALCADSNVLFGGGDRAEAPVDN
jgi:RNA polymerase sigma factor (sigma-70 family)